MGRARRLAVWLVAAAIAQTAVAGCGDGGGRGDSGASTPPPAAAPVAAPATSAQAPVPETTPATTPPASVTPTASGATTPTASAPPTSAGPGKPPVATTRPPAPATTAAKPAPPRFPVPVQLGDARQLITVAARGSYATVSTWQRQTDGSWTRLTVTENARIGANGVVAGSSRKQNTSTTPGGTYTLTEAFGINADPGTAMPYTRVGADHWWVQDNNSAYYNQMRLGSQGGFDRTLPESHTDGSERLAAHDPAYRYSVVIDFNRSPAVPYRGAGIFLHVNGSGATAGCVSVPQDFLAATLRWLDPAQKPRIAIG
ncbi:L,D-transpeptidase family protein [Yinghuangia sp. YIM S09857]|uniref:L,D-transpeptidase family protein n=1 Tax=Yinghuangia sp. YIM S09857 TaxID=3436929 RepID=UPI003F536068